MKVICSNQGDDIMTTNRNVKKYDKDEKEKIIARMLPPENYSPTKLSRDTGISVSTLSTWKAKAVSSQGKFKQQGGKFPSSKEKFLIVMETYNFSEIELSKYCRENGLYVKDVKAWREGCITGNDSTKNNNPPFYMKQELQDEKKKTKELQKELRRKEKALAETAALLVLRKKLDAILGGQEED